MIFFSDKLEILKTHLHEFLNSIHWNTLYNLEIKELDTLHFMFEACIDTSTWIIHFIFHTKFIDMFNNLLKKEGFANSEEKPHLLAEKSPELNNLMNIAPFSAIFHILLRDLLAGIALHEYGHSNICPIQKENFSLIVQAISTALEQEKKYHPKILSYVLNLFSDTIVNTTLGLEADKTFFRNAQFMFYYANLLLHGTDDILFGFFLLLNIKLFQFHHPIRQRLHDIIVLTMPADYPEVLKQLIEVFCPFPEISENMWNGVNLNDTERWRVINRVNNMLDWDEMAYKFTKLIIKYLPDPLMLDHPPVPDSIFTKNFKDDPKFKADIMERILKRKIEKNITYHGTNSSQKDINTKKPVKPHKSSVKPAAKPARANVQSVNSLNEKYPGENSLQKGFASITIIEFLVILYQFRIKELQIKLPQTQEANKFPISWMSRQILTEKDNPLLFDPLTVYYLPSSDELLLYKKAVPLTADELGAAREKKFPNLAIFCDDSGSMHWDPLKGTDKYDAVLIMLFSLFNWLKTHNFAASIKYNIINFSSTTRTSGWLDYYHLNEIFPQIFKPEGAGTVLDLDEFRHIISHPEDKVVLIITDGFIAKPDKIKAVLKEDRAKINLLFIQIGELSPLANDLQKAGFSVVQIKDISKLGKIALDFIKKAYRETI